MCAWVWVCVCVCVVGGEGGGLAHWFSCLSVSLSALRPVSACSIVAEYGQTSMQSIIYIYIACLSIYIYCLPQRAVFGPARVSRLHVTKQVFKPHTGLGALSNSIDASSPVTTTAPACARHQHLCVQVCV